MGEPVRLIPLGEVAPEDVERVVKTWGVSRLLVEPPYAVEPRYGYFLEQVTADATRDDAVSVAAFHEGSVVGLSVLRFPRWDEELFGFRVGRVEHLIARDPGVADALAHGLVGELEAREAAFCSARLSSDDLPALQALELAGFRFQEHTLAPWRTLDDWDSRGFACTRPTEDVDLPHLCDIARRAFRTDRFHRDPRFDRATADGLYEKWVRTWHSQTVAGRDSRVLLVEGKVAGFAMTEIVHPGNPASLGVALMVLTAVDPDLAGKGLGHRMYGDVLDRARDQAKYFSALVAGANVAVVNLYAKLGFRLSTGGEVTLHWWTRSNRGGACAFS